MSKFSLGKLSFDTPLILAPMAGTSTVAFRSICHEFGAAYQPTELVSARSIVYSGIERSYRYLRFDKEKEGIACIQLFGNEPQDFCIAIERICNDERLADVDIIDINMGCPVPKVVKTGAGSALMRTPDLACNIVSKSREICARYGKFLTVKTRIGFTEDDKNCGKHIEFARDIATSGAQLIAVHGRTATAMYHGEADIDAIAQMSDAVRDCGVPFVANGDIVDGIAAKLMLDRTGADGLMIGRAAQGNPWVFEQINRTLKGEAVLEEVSFDKRRKMLLRELRETIKYIDEDVAVREMRPSMMAYIKGMPGATRMKVRLCAALTVEEVEEILWEI